MGVAICGFCGQPSGREMASHHSWEECHNALKDKVEQLEWAEDALDELVNKIHQLHVQSGVCVLCGKQVQGERLVHHPTCPLAGFTVAA